MIDWRSALEAAYITAQKELDNLMGVKLDFDTQERYAFWLGYTTDLADLNTRIPEEEAET